MKTQSQLERNKKDKSTTEPRTERTYWRRYLIEIVEALLQTPQAADAGLQQTAGARILLT